MWSCEQTYDWDIATQYLKLCNYLMKSGDFLHRKQGSGLYWLLFTVFVEFKVFTIKKKSFSFINLVSKVKQCSNSCYMLAGKQTGWYSDATNSCVTSGAKFTGRHEYFRICRSCFVATSSMNDHMNRNLKVSQVLQHPSLPVVP